MKKSNAKSLAVGLLVLVGALTIAPASQAQTCEAPAGYARVSVELAHDSRAPAAKVYRDLQRLADNACEHVGDRLLVMRQADRECVAEMIKSGVAQLGRADVAELHKGRVAVASR